MWVCASSAEPKWLLWVLGVERKKKKKKKKEKKGMPGLKSLVLGGNGVMKCCEASRLTGMLDMLLRYGSHKKKKKLSDEKLKTCAKRGGVF